MLLEIIYLCKKLHIKIISESPDSQSAKSKSDEKIDVFLKNNNHLPLDSKVEPLNLRSRTKNDYYQLSGA